MSDEDTRPEGEAKAARPEARALSRGAGRNADDDDTLIGLKAQIFHHLFVDIVYPNTNKAADNPPFCF